MKTGMLTIVVGPGEMAVRLRTLVTLVEKLGMVPITYMTVDNHM